MTTIKNQRIDNLKILAKLAKQYLDYYKKLNNQKTNNWVSKKTENSIQQLKDIIAQIKIDLHPKKVESYCKPFPTFDGFSVGEILQQKNSKEKNVINEFLADHLEQTNINFVLFDITRFAPEQNIIHDITWLTDGTLNDFIEIGLGIKNVEYFEIYLSAKIQETENCLIPYFKTQNCFTEKIKLIHQAIRNSKDEEFLASNILLITVTESIVRETCKFIYKKQNATLNSKEVDDYIYYKFNSLDTLLSKGTWKNDYPIGLAEAITTYKDVSETNMNIWRDKYQKHKKANSKFNEITSKFSLVLENAHLKNEEFLKNKIQENLNNLNDLIPDFLSENDKQIKINISIMLNFLIRKYKDDRNSIIHGNFESFNHKWKNYINYSALLKVFDTYKIYQDLYS